MIEKDYSSLIIDNLVNTQYKPIFQRKLIFDFHRLLHKPVLQNRTTAKPREKPHLTPRSFVVIRGHLRGNFWIG